MESEAVSVDGDIATLSDLQAVDKERGKCWHLGTHVATISRGRVDTNAQYSTSASVTPSTVRLLAALSTTPARNFRD